jgi:hypothetical protein
MAMQITLLILMLATPLAYGAQHTVGGTNGWTTGEDYTTWATGQTFVVGDTLCKFFFFFLSIIIMWIYHSLSWLTLILLALGFRVIRVNHVILFYKERYTYIYAKA